MFRRRAIEEHPRLQELTVAFRADVLALGLDVVLSEVDGILTIRVALNTAPGFLGGVR